MSYFNIVAQSSESTVVTEYKPQSKRSDGYQSEAALEQEFIRLLCELGYERLTIHKEADLIANLRTQLEKLNNYRFTDGEWKRFWDEVLANTNSGILEKTRLIQEDYVQVLRRDNGESKNIQLIDKKCIHNNSLQVINQYAISTEEGAAHDNRYDVTVLVNGLPLIHIELKRRGVPIREAFNQIDRYQRDSFWASSGLYEFVQIFVISNGTNTKYYSNTTRFNHIKDAKAQKTKKSKTSNSFEFTSFWADANNRIIPDLVDFTKTFFCKHTILNILTRYCVFTAENMLLVMRPYQIVATERILNRIEIANNYKKYGFSSSNGLDDAFESWRDISQDTADSYLESLSIPVSAVITKREFYDGGKKVKGESYASYADYIDAMVEIFSKTVQKFQRIIPKKYRDQYQN